MSTYLRYLTYASIAVIFLDNPVAGQHADAAAPPSVPTEIQVPAENTAFLKAHAVGTQNYICLPTSSGFSWTFFGPQATLFFTFKWISGDIRQQIMTHFLSPNPDEGGTPRATWQSSLDTSRV